jgi:hypothetical protein
MTQYLLALYKADDEKRPPEQTRQVWADVGAAEEAVQDAFTVAIAPSARSRTRGSPIGSRAKPSFRLVSGPFPPSST